MVLVSVLLVIIVVTLSMCLLLEYQCYMMSRVTSIARILPPSAKCRSFYEWSRMIQKQSSLSFTDLSSPDVMIPSVPHLILCNHIRSHFELGSFLTMAGSVQNPSDIVCYEKYRTFGPASPIINDILRNEITVGAELDRDAKKLRMCQGIRDSLARGRNVIMFIDAHDYMCPMRTLNRKVLEHFPDVPKQLVEVLEPTGVNGFRYRRSQPTTCLSSIISLREEHLLRAAGTWR